MFEYSDIYNDIKALNIKEGDTLFLRISYKSIGKIKGGPKVFIDALLDVIGNEGTIILTAFPKKYISQFRFFKRNKVYSESNLPKPTTGIMTEIAISYPESRISKKIEGAFVVIGKNAKYLTSNHTHEKDVYWLLEEAIDKFNCKCLRVGGEPYIGTTHISLNHVFKEKNFYQNKLKYGLYIKENGKSKWYEANNVYFCTEGFKSFLPLFLSKIKINEGKIGEGYAIITDMNKSIDEEKKLFEADVKKILCNDINCLLCRTSYPFSDTNKILYLSIQFKRLFSLEYKNAIKNIYSFIMNILFGKRLYK